ncbi:MAG: tetratricopeptide repeat protein [Acidimicrobiales bacterium]
MASAPLRGRGAAGGTARSGTRPPDSGARRAPVSGERSRRGGGAKAVDPTRRWGNVARRGAAALSRLEAPASAGDRDRLPGRRPAPEVPWQPDQGWVEVGPSARRGAAPSPDHQPRRSRVREGPGQGLAFRARTAASESHRFSVPRPVLDELTSTAGAKRAAKLASHLADATHAYERGRFQDARRLLRPLAVEAPGSPAVRELYGLVLYRMGQWGAAARQLESYRAASGAYDQHPVLADCYRALRRFDAADRLWDELRAASPGADAVAEGRIVAAGCLADRGQLAGAIALLERADRHLRRPEDRHLRQWYVLADLYERAGDVPRAREMFGRIRRADPDAYDARRRQRALA